MKKLIFLVLAFTALGGLAEAFAPHLHQTNHRHAFTGGPPKTAALVPKVRLVLASRATETKLCAQAPGETGTNLAPSAFFLVSSASLVKLYVEIQASDFTMTPGIYALLFTTIAICWDNFIIGIGQPLFADVEANEEKFNLLKNLSFPRFTAHAVFLPFLYATVAEIGKAMGIEWLQSDLVQNGVIVAAAVLAVVSRTRFVNSEGIMLKDTSDSPPEAWERSLVWFTYKEPDFSYVLPAIVLSLLNLAVGIAGVSGDYRNAAIWMIVSAVSVLYGSAKPSYIMRFSGQLGEVVMMWSIFEAASIVS